MQIVKTKFLTNTQIQQINRLWNDEYPMKLKDRLGLLLIDADSFNHYLIEDQNSNVLAWAVNFQKEKETRFSIIVDRNHQGKGFGSTLIKQLKIDLNEFYGWVINHNLDKKESGEYYRSPLSFYIKQGFEVLYNTIDTDILKAVKVKWSCYDHRK